MAEEHPKDLLHVQNIEVANAYSLPPNNFQPGVTFAFMKFNQCLQVMFLYYEEILSESETENMCVQVKQNLLASK